MNDLEKIKILHYVFKRKQNEYAVLTDQYSKIKYNSNDKSSLEMECLYYA